MTFLTRRFHWPWLRPLVRKTLGGAALLFAGAYLWMGISLVQIREEILRGSGAELLPFLTFAASFVYAAIGIHTLKTTFSAKIRSLQGEQP